MNKREIEKQALNSLNTYFKDNPDKVLNDFERKPLDKEDITKIVNEEIQAQEKKVESLEVLRKNIAIEAEESLEKVLGKRITSKKSPNKRKLRTKFNSFRMSKNIVFYSFAMNKILL